MNSLSCRLASPSLPRAGTLLLARPLLHAGAVPHGFPLVPYHVAMRTLLLIAFAASLTACHSQLKPPAERLEGTWSSTYDGTVIQLIAEDDTSGVYVIRDPDAPMQLLTGNFDATQTEITFVDELGDCEGVDGRYEYAILTSAIQLDLEHDDCPRRESKATTEAWVRVFTPDPDADSDAR